MSGATPGSDDSAALDFSALYAADQKRGLERSLPEWLQLFPGHEDRIAAEYLRLKAGGGLGPADPLGSTIGGGRNSGDYGSSVTAVTHAGSAGSTGPTRVDAHGEPAFSTGEPGERLGPYRIVKELGRGGQGAVFLAQDTRSDREVALKVLTKGGHLDPLLFDRFRREAMITSKLDHPGICPVYEVGLERGTPYLAMKALRGDTLARKIATARERSPNAAAGAASTHVILDDTSVEPPSSRTSSSELNSQGPPPQTQVEIDRVLRLVESAARALHVAHEAGVVHRDIKPGNIIVTEEGEPVVLDFGLARDDEGDSPTLTNTGDLMGTPAYMSPEQIAAQRIRLDRRTDVFSLGVTLFECLSLQRPFDAPTRGGLYQAIMTKDPPDLRRLNPAITDTLRVVVETALEKDRDRRYATALDLAEELRRVRLAQPILAKPVGPLLKLYRWAERNPALAAALFGLFVVLAAGLATSLYFLDKRDDALQDKTAALGVATTERNAKAAALADYDRLGDVSRLARISDEADGLWPASPANKAAMSRLLVEAAALETRIPGHIAARDALRASPKVLPYSEADRASDAESLRPIVERRERALRQREEVAAKLRAAESGAAARMESDNSVSTLRSTIRTIDTALRMLDARLSARPTWRFSNESTQFKHDTITKLVADLENFFDQDPLRGRAASIRKRLSFVVAAEASMAETHASRWAHAIASISDPGQCPKYGGLKLSPQFGLVPIRQDPHSGLWEFAHLQTTGDGADPVPSVRSDGRYDLNASTGLIFVLIPGGSFRMGARRPTAEEREDAADGGSFPENVDPAAESIESPPHDVALGPYFISKFEMTQGQWTAFSAANPSHYPPGNRIGNTLVTLVHPVEQVSWEDCAGAQGALVRMGLTLPTEAQWEYACRADTTTAWWTGGNRSTIAAGGNVSDQSVLLTDTTTGWDRESWNDGHPVHAPVGSYAANRFGLFDMSGNVWEWCQDLFAPYAADNLRAGDGLRNPTANPSSRVARGGGFSESALRARVSTRTALAPRTQLIAVGVRPARSIDTP